MILIYLGKRIFLDVFRCLESALYKKANLIDFFTDSLFSSFLVLLF